MATTKMVRGAALVKKVIAAAAEKVPTPEPLAAGVLKKLRLPNDEKLTPALKAFLAFDVSYLGWSIDDEEPEFEPMGLDELVAQVFGEESVTSFGEAIELLGDDCVLFEQDGDEKHFLYFGTPDAADEYPVISLAMSDEGSRVFGFVPFDIWLGQRFGVLPATLPDDLAAVCKTLADENGDGRTSFLSQTRDVAAGGGSDDDEEEEDE